MTGTASKATHERAKSPRQDESGGGEKNDLKGVSIDQLKAQNEQVLSDYHKRMAEWSRNVDQRYAWVTLAVLWLTFAATLGSYRIYGLVFARVTKDGIYTREDASWPVSTIFTVENSIGPFVSIIAFYLPYKYSMLIGGTLIALGNGLAYWSDNLLFDILLIGCAQGVGYAFVFMPFMGVINSYFLKYRNIALGVSLCGGTMSVFVLTPLIRWILDTYSWRTAYLAIGFIGCIDIMLVPLIRPNPRPELPQTRSGAAVQDQSDADGQATESKSKTMTSNTSSASLRALTYQNSMRRQSTVMISQRHGSIISVNPFATTVGFERKISRAMMDLDTAAHQQQHLERGTGTKGDELAAEDARSLHDIELEVARSGFESTIITDILKTPGFHVIWYLELIYYWIFGIYCLVLVDLGVDRGCSRDEARNLMMFQSAGELLGRLILPIFVDMHFCSHRTMVVIDLLIMTVILCAIPYVSGFFWISLLTALLNAFASLLYILLNGLLVGVLGERKVTIGYGLASCIVGILILFRPHAVGFFRDYMGSYEWLLITLGLGCALGAVLCVFEELVSRYCLERTRKKNTPENGNPA